MVRREPATGPRATPNGVKTNMTKTTGWAPCGQRLVDHAPFGHWRSQTFIAALRHDRLDEPWVINGAMNVQTWASAGSPCLPFEDGDDRRNLTLQFHFMRVFSDARLLDWLDVVGARMTMAE